MQKIYKLKRNSLSSSFNHTKSSHVLSNQLSKMFGPLKTTQNSMFHYPRTQAHPRKPAKLRQNVYKSVDLLKNREPKKAKQKRKSKVAYIKKLVLNTEQSLHVKKNNKRNMSLNINQLNFKKPFRPKVKLSKKYSKKGLKIRKNRAKKSQQTCSTLKVKDTSSKILKKRKKLRKNNSQPQSIVLKMIHKNRPQSNPKMPRKSPKAKKPKPLSIEQKLMTIKLKLTEFMKKSSTDKKFWVKEIEILQEEITYLREELQYLQEITEANERVETLHNQEDNQGKYSV